MKKYILAIALSAIALGSMALTQQQVAQRQQAKNSGKAEAKIAAAMQNKNKNIKPSAAQNATCKGECNSTCAILDSIYRTPDFNATATTMISLFAEAKQKADKDKVKFKDKKKEIFDSAKYITPVMETIDDAGINGFNLDNLNMLGINPAKYEPLQNALIEKVKKGKEQKNINEVSNALSGLYYEYVKKVEKRYSIKEKDNVVTAKLFDSHGHNGIDLTFTNGRISKIENVSVSYSLRAPETQRGGIDFSFNKNGQPWLTEKDDPVLWRTLFDPGAQQAWATTVTKDGDIMLEYKYGDDKAWIKGFNKDYVASRNIYQSPENDLFFEWAAPYYGLQLPQKGLKTIGTLTLVTPSGEYPIQADGSIAFANSTADKIYNNIVAENKKKAEEKRKNDAEWKKKSYVDVLSITARNVSANNKLISTLEENGTFYADDMRYIQPVINIESETSTDRKIKLYYRIIRMNEDGTQGTMLRGSDSPLLYTNYTEFELTPTTKRLVFRGWGMSKESIFTPGIYKIQIFSENRIQLGEDRLFEIKAKEPVNLDVIN